MVADDPESFADLDGHLTVCYGEKLKLAQCQEAQDTPLTGGENTNTASQSSNQHFQEQETNSTLNHIQTALDVAGFIPLVGDVANAANAAVSLGRGNYGEAALSALAAIPLVGVVGEVGKGAKLAKEAEEAVSVYQKAETAYVGISKNIAQREIQHGEKLVEVAGGLTRKQARGVEQAIIEQKGLAKNGGILTNKINSIVYNEAVAFGKQLLNSIGF